MFEDLAVPEDEGCTVTSERRDLLTPLHCIRSQKTRILKIKSCSPTAVYIFRSGVGNYEERGSCRVLLKCTVFLGVAWGGQESCYC
jgi:hypothetical protein